MKPHKKLPIILMILLLSFASVSNANCEQDLKECVSTCNEVIDAAESAIKSCQGETQLQQMLIETQEKRFEDMSKEINKLQGERDTWYRNPLIMGLIGVVVGGILVK